MAPPVKTYLRTKETNHDLVVKVRLPKTSTRRRRHRRRTQTRRAKRGQNLKLCDFPADLVENILDGLTSADRIRFGATCKKNLSLVSSATTKHSRHQYQIRAIDKLPLLAEFGTRIDLNSTARALKFSLFDARHVQGQPNYATYQIKDPKGHGFGNWTSPAVKASKKGWLLCLWAKQEEEGKETAGLASFLLFSPFNKRVIKLPDLNHRFVHSMDQVSCRATFSSDPSSPDCIYFFLSQANTARKVIISTLDHQASKEWKTIVFDRLMSCVSSVVYHEGCFYCISEKCQLAAYDVVQQSLKLIIGSSPLCGLVPCSFLVDKYVLVCEGKVILVVLDRKPLQYKPEEMNSSCCLFEFSSSARAWVKKTSLDNHHALFVGHSSFSVPVDDIAERVYFYSSSNDRLRSFYYSLKDGHCHPSKDSGYWSSDVSNGIWIEPPSSLTASLSGLA